MASVRNLYEAKPRPSSFTAKRVSLGSIPTKHQQWIAQDYVLDGGRRADYYEVNGGEYYVIKEEQQEGIGAVYVSSEQAMYYLDERGWNSGDDSEPDDDLLQTIFDSVN